MNDSKGFAARESLGDSKGFGKSLGDSSKGFGKSLGDSKGFGMSWGGGGRAGGASMEPAVLVPPPSPGSSPRVSGPRCIMGAATLANIGKSNGENQDTFVTSANPSGTKCFVGVFDGHGEKGKLISNFSRTTMTKTLFAHKDLHSDPRRALEGACEETERQIERDYNHDAAYSGTTAVVIYQHRDQLFCANIGDSRAVLGCCDTARGPGGGDGLKAVELSSDHKPSRPDEKRRVTDLGGIVQQSAVPVQQNGGGVRLVRMGPERVMCKSGFGGLAVSRALGDLSLRPYVSSQPEILERKLTSKDKVLILGSDGIWDRISSQEAVNIASRHGDPIQAARMLASVARKRWQAETQGMLADDITAVVVALDHDGTGAASAMGGASNAPHESLSLTQPTHGTSASLGASMRRKPADLAETLTPLMRNRRSASTSAMRDLEADPSRPVTGGPEGFAGHGPGDRLRRNQSASQLQPFRRPNTGTPNHLLPPAGSRR